MGNETFYWDGLMVIKFVTPARVLLFSVLSCLSFFFDFPRSRMRVNFLPFRILGPGWFHSTVPLSGYFFEATFYVAYIETFLPFSIYGVDTSCKPWHNVLVRMGLSVWFKWCWSEEVLLEEHQIREAKSWTWSCSYNRVRILVFNSTFFPFEYPLRL